MLIVCWARVILVVVCFVEREYSVRRARGFVLDVVVVFKCTPDLRNRAKGSLAVDVP
jgi:hypothetical protein